MRSVKGMAWFLLLIHIHSSLQQEPNIYSYIEQKEKQVREMADAFVKLDAARCDLIANCSSDCSRHACTPIDIKDKSKYDLECTDIQQDANPYCPAPDPEQHADYCNNKHKVNYAMSYVRLPSTIKIFELPQEICAAVCTTRSMDDAYKKISKMDASKEEYSFGSIEGIHRFYPGREQEDSICYNYDPRKRPWYNGAISVKKYITILLDHSFDTMRNPLTPSLEFPINASRTIAQEILYTLSTEDQATVISFDEQNNTTLVPDSVEKQNDLGSGLTGQMKMLSDAISNVNPIEEWTPSSKNGFQNATFSALQHYENRDDEFLRVMMVLTNGGFDSELEKEDIEKLSEMLKNHSTTLLVYSFNESPNLKSLANGAGGNYETLTTNFNNPLYQIRSYFNFLALARNASGNIPYWTDFYKNSGGLGNITTLSYQVVSPQGRLIGVVAIGIMLIDPDLPQALGDRKGKRPINPKATFDARATAIDKNVGCPCDGSQAICKKSSDLKFTELRCCDECYPKSKKFLRNTLLVAVLLPGGVVLLIIILLLSVWRSRINRREKTPVGEGIYGDPFTRDTRIPEPINSRNSSHTSNAIFTFVQRVVLCRRAQEGN